MGVITQQSTFVQDNPKTTLVNDPVIQGSTGFDVLFDFFASLRFCRFSNSGLWIARR